MSSSAVRMQIAAVAFLSALSWAAPAAASPAALRGPNPFQEPAEASPGRAPPPHAACAEAVAAAERGQALPRRLLDAVALVESGRWVAPGKSGPGTGPAEGAIVAWPWTVMAEGRGRYLPSKEAAIREVESLRARGVRNIDVGCMQVNLMHHPDAFADLEEAFDPGANAAYAAEFLIALQARHRTWSMAVRHYHSGNPDRQRAYYDKVYKAWTEIKRADAQDRARKRDTEIAAASTVPAAPDPAAKPVRRLTALGGVSNWPPRSLADQRRAENMARAMALSPR